MSDASLDDRALLLQLVKEVQDLKKQVQHQRVLDRLNDLEEQVSDIFTQVRLQARQHSTTASQLQLSLSHLGSNAGCSEPASPRVAGPLSSPGTARLALPMLPGTATPSTASPRNNGRAAAGSFNNGSTAGGTHLNGSTISSTQRPAATAVTSGASASTDAAVQESGAGQLGMFGAMKNWAQGAMATDALAAAEMAQATAVRCQQQVMELVGRHGAAERRLDTLWQLQDSSAQTDAAVGRLQQELRQSQSQLLQLQQNLTQVHEQLSSTEQGCSFTINSCEHLQATIDHVAKQTHLLEHGLQQHQDAACVNRQQQEQQVAAVHQQLEQHMQQMQGQLDVLQQKADRAAAAAADGLSKCELLRQAGVLVERRVEAMPGLIQKTAQPLQDRLADAEASLGSLSAASSVTKSAVQPDQLSSAVAQLSTASKRQQQQLAVQLAGLAGRLEALEDDAARRGQVISQDDFKQQISQLHACLDGAVSQANQNLNSKLANKADVSQLTATNSNLAARLDSSEQRLMQGLKLLADKTTAALQLKADDGAVRASSRKVADKLADIRNQVAAAGTRLAGHHSKTSQQRLGSETASLSSTSAQTGEGSHTSVEELSDDVSPGGLPLQAVGLCGNAICSSVGIDHDGPAKSTGGMEHVPVAGKAEIKNAQQQPQQGRSAAGASTGHDETNPVGVLSAVRPDDLLVVGHQQLLALGAAVASDSISVIAGSPTAHSGPAAADHCQSRSTSRGQQNSLFPQAEVDKPAEAGLITIGSHHIRPVSTLRPWSKVTSSPSPASLRKTGNGAVHSAAHNAKLIKAGKDKQAMQQKILQTGSNMKPDLQ